MELPIQKILPIFIILFLHCYHTQCKGVPNIQEKDAAYWNTMAQNDLKAAIAMKPNLNVAKNVILFLGDGMGLSTVTAGRILKGQLKGNPGEEENLAFDTFPFSALVKTYNVDRQTPDSAGTATAFLCGIKANEGTVGVTARALREDCPSLAGNEVTSILDWSQSKGKSVGLVTTARVTHATPAAAFAHSTERDWESDANMDGVSGGCKDIADQLVTDNPDIQVVLGGGRRSFVPLIGADPDLEADAENNRRDGRNLIDEWARNKMERGNSYAILNNTKDLRQVNPANTEYVLGLFNKDHIDYEVDRDTSENGQPSLSEMTELAIKVLQRNEKGFFLLVEGGRIDHGHHDGQAKRALYELLAMDTALETALNLTNQKDTLIVVTADHSHVFVIAGYPSRGNDILGLTDNFGTNPPLDDKPSTTLLYGNGPGHISPRQNLTGVDVGDKDFMQQSAVPIQDESHGGEDVAVYASGPMSHLLHGVREQNYIAHVMAYASCVGQNTDHCKPKSSPTCGGSVMSARVASIIPLSSVILHCYIYLTY